MSVEDQCAACRLPEIPGYFRLRSCREELTGEDVVVSVLAAVLRQQSRVLGLVSADIFKVLTANKRSYRDRTVGLWLRFHGDKCAYDKVLR